MHKSVIPNSISGITASLRILLFTLSLIHIFGLKAVETGAEIADKVAAEADKVDGKAKEKWEQ